MRLKSRGGSGGVGVDEARDDRKYGTRRICREACLHGIPAAALAPDQDEQRDRAHQPRDQDEDETEVHSGARVEQVGVAGHVETGGDERIEGKGGEPEEDGAEAGKSISERILTIPELTIPQRLFQLARTTKSGLYLR